MKNTTIIGIFLLMVLASCNQGMKSGQVTDMPADPQRAQVLEVIQTTSYTYLRVDRNRQEEWIAIDKAELKTGDIIYYADGLEMLDFESPELNRTFDRILFVSRISDQPITAQEDPHAGMMGDQPQRPVLTRLDITIDRPEGSASIAELYSKRDGFNGKTVMVKGQVTKVNSGIMGRNWVHIQDGTADGDNFDLTITTDDEPAVGDIVTFSGTLNLDRDFGAGYTYELILEDAKPLR